MCYRIVSAIFAVLLVAAAPARADVVPLFADDSVLDVTIRAPIKTLMKERPDEEYLEGTFEYREADGTTTELSLKLRTRGNFRRNKDNCAFAPIRLNFKKKEVTGTLFEGQDKLKLVTHCRTEGTSYEQSVAREYVAYRLLNALSDVSYSVRMFNIKYIDSDNGKKTTRLGFVIEDDEAVAERNGLQVVKVDRIVPEQLDRERQNLIHVYEYLIGNTEYSFVNKEPGKSCCHNVDVLSKDGEPPYLPLPFDYDFSGLVNAPYAQPNPHYPIIDVRTRFYKGICANNDILPKTIETFLASRPEMEQILNDADFLSSRSRRTLEMDLNRFFDIITDPERTQRELATKCAEREDFYGIERKPST